MQLRVKDDVEKCAGLPACFRYQRNMLKLYKDPSDDENPLGIDALKRARYANETAML